MKSAEIKAITEALAKAQPSFLPIKKSVRVDFQTKGGTRVKYNYAPLDEVIEATKKALSDNGLAITQSTYIQGDSIILETLLSHSSGEWLSGELYVGPKGQPPQEEGSALTYKRRYGISAMLCVASEEDDDAEKATAEKKDLPAVVLDTEKHWCEKHNTKFFKTPKMKAYAHPVKNEDGSPTLDGEGKQLWCGESPTKPETAPQPAQSKSSPVKEESKGIAPPELEVEQAEGEPQEEKGGEIDTPEKLYDWIAKKMKWKSPTTARSWIVNKCRIDETRIDTDPEGVYLEIKALQGWD